MEGMREVFEIPQWPTRCTAGCRARLCSAKHLLVGAIAAMIDGRDRK